jgi:hypothetical protein
MQITTLLYLYFWCFFLINKNYLNVISVKTNPYLYLLFKRIKKNMKLSIPKILYIYWNSYFLSTSSRVKFSLMILKTKLKMMIYVQYMYKLHISCLLSTTFIYILYIAIIIVLVAIFSYISNFHRLLILHQVLCL